MIAFDVYVNGKRVCRAGIGETGVLHSILHWVVRRGEMVGDALPKARWT